MSDESIKVYILDLGRKFLYARYRDPVSGKLVTRSTGKTTKKEALKFAGNWEQELRTGKYKPRSLIGWDEFRERYESEVLPGLAKNTRAKVGGIFNKLEKHVAPLKLAAVTATLLSKYWTKLRDEGARENTIRGHAAHLKAALRWAEKMKLIPNCPEFNLPKRTKGSKLSRGRPITGEEFDRLIAAVPLVVGEVAAPAWRHLLTGLWWSGLRLGEALILDWNRPDTIHVDLTGKYPVLKILGEYQKSGEDQVLPIAPEFGKLLLDTPDGERDGLVFKLVDRNGRPYTPPIWDASTIIAKIGKKSGVIVDHTKKKYASAHDLRRSFGLRWGSRILPADLKDLMRHADISTTMKYYAVGEAQSRSDTIWGAVGEKAPSKATSQREGDQEQPQPQEQPSESPGNG